MVYNSYSRYMICKILAYFFVHFHLDFLCKNAYLDDDAICLTFVEIFLQFICSNFPIIYLLVR